MQTSCPSCQFKIGTSWFFCPNCGKQLKDKIPVVTVGKQILIYFVSFFLAPLGLGWGFKYVTSKDTKVRMIGVVAIVLTVISVVILLFSFNTVADQYIRILNGAGL